MTQPPNFDPNQQPTPAQIENVAPQYPVNGKSQTDLNIMAIVGFALAITCSGCGIGSLILSIIGLIQINKNPERYHGKGFAVAGIIISAFVIVLFVIYLIVLIFAAALLPDGGNYDSDLSNIFSSI